MRQYLQRIENPAARRRLRAVFFAVCVCLALSGLLPYFLYPVAGAYMGVLRFHSLFGVPCFLLLLVWLFVEARRPAGWRLALLVALYPFLCIVSLMTPSPLLVVFLFDISFVPAFIYLLFARRPHGGEPVALAARAMFVYFLAVTFFTGFFSMVDPILLRFEFFHRKAHGTFAFLFLFYAVYYLVSLKRQGGYFRGGRQLALHTLLLVLLAFPAGLACKWVKQSRLREGYAAHTVSTSEMAALEGVPFKPIDGTILEDSLECRKCHPIPYRQWARSVHAFSSRNLSFQTTARALLEKHGPEFLRHCALCHDPAVALSEDPTMLVDPEHVAQSEGVSCRACHYMVHQGGRNGAYKVAIARGDLAYPDTERRQRYILTSVLEHVQDMTKPITRDGTQCFPCHRLQVRRQAGMVAPVDNVTSFVDSPFATEMGINCHDCHMPRLERDERSYTWRDHQFLGIQTFLPSIAINVREEDQAEIDRFRKDNENWLFGKLAYVAPIEMFMDETFKSYRIYNYGKAVRKIRVILDMLTAEFPFTMELEKAEVRRQEDATLLDLSFSTVNRTVGHEFPSALFANIVECWFELRLEDRDGNLLYQSQAGGTPETRLGRVEVDTEGHPIFPHQSPHYVAMVNEDHYLRPLEKYLTRHEIRVPAGVGFPLKATYTLNYKRYADSHTRWVTNETMSEVPVIRLCAADFLIQAPGIAKADSETGQPD